MKSFGLVNNALRVGFAASLLAGCGGSQPPIGTPGAMPQTSAIATHADRAPRSAYTMLYSFKGGHDDGQWPHASVTNLSGTLYGTTPRGGRHRCYKIKGCGTAFSMTTSGEETILHSFDGNNGSRPAGALLNVNGTLYGVTGRGGTNCNADTGGCGTVFSITPSGRETVLYRFKGYPDDGAIPTGGLIEINGTLYGTTFLGGSGKCDRGTVGYVGCGTAFAITTSGSERPLYSFGSAKYDGNFPNGSLSDVKGRLYGTTPFGGRHRVGTVFSLTISGQESLIHRFNTDHKGNGTSPAAGLINIRGTLYGTTAGGGANSAGTVFSITPSGTFSLLHSFGGVGDGIGPEAELLDVNGTLYGSTFAGGADDLGTVFSITLSGAENVLYSFMGYPNDGAYPGAALVAVNGTLYGTTEFGGSGSCTRPRQGYFPGCGTVFALSP
jgi:uncharacterized repeat protein (TIGR03803 family)